MKKLVIDPLRCTSEPQTLPLGDTDFESGQDFAILVRERTQGTKLNGSYMKRESTLGVDQPYNQLPKSRKQQCD